MTPPRPVPIEDLLAHRDWVRALARSLVADESRADDLEQETWTRALAHPPTRADSLRGWLGRVVRSAWIDTFRSESQRVSRERAVARPEAARGDDVVAQMDAHRRVVDLVAALGEPYRTTLLLRYFEGLGVRETAARLGVPEETIHTRVRRALAQIRLRLDEQTNGDRAAWCVALLPLARWTGGAAVKTGTKTAIAACLALLAIGGATAVVIATRAETSPPSAADGSDAPSTVAAATVRPKTAQVPDAAGAAASQTAAVADDANAALSGVVRTPGGGLAANAHVRVVPISDSTDAKLVAATVETDAAGRFAFNELAPRDYAIDAWSAGVGSALVPRVRVEAAKPARVVIRLAEEVAVAGTVVAEEDGRPVAGATVRADALGPVTDLEQRFQGGRPATASPREARTDDAGRFRLAPIVAGACTLTVGGPGRIERVVTVRAPADGVAIPLVRGGSVRAIVTLLGDDLPRELLVAVWGRRDEEKHAVTGRDTVVVVDGLEPGDTEVLVRAIGHGKARAAVRIEAGRETTAPPIVLEAPAIVPVSVREAGTERPIAGASVNLQSIERSGMSSSGALEGTVVTDASGEAAARLRVGEWRAVPSKPGYVMRAEDLETSGLTFVVGRDPQQVALHLRPAPSIVGRVTYQDGTPAEGAKVSVASVSQNPELPESGTIGYWADQDDDVETARDGTFRIRGTPVHQKYGLLVVGPAGERATLDGVVFEKGKLETEVSIRVDRGAAGSVEGRVVDEAGLSVEGAIVWIRHRRALTGADGTFRVEGIAAGKASAAVGAVGFAFRATPEVDVTAGTTTRIPDVVLRRRGLTIHGRITDASGAPVARAEVWTSFDLDATDFPAGANSGGVGPDGAYFVDGPDVPPHEITVYFRAPGFSYTTRTVTPAPDATLDIVLSREATAEVAVSFDGPTPAIPVVEAAHGGVWNAPAMTWDTESRTAHVKGIEPGTVQFRVTADGYAPGGFQTVIVPDGGSVVLRAVRLTAGGALTGRVLDAGGRPLAGVQVSCGDQFIFCDTGADGRFRLEHLPPGRWEFGINGIEGMQSTPSPRFVAAVEEGKATEVEWRVAR
jgi:RNA polymerase sigma-70 factor (ECF subfamily)